MTELKTLPQAELKCRSRSNDTVSARRSKKWQPINLILLGSRRRWQADNVTFLTTPRSWKSEQYKVDWWICYTFLQCSKILTSYSQRQPEWINSYFILVTFAIPESQLHSNTKICSELILFVAIDRIKAQWVSTILVSLKSTEYLQRHQNHRIR